MTSFNGTLLNIPHSQVMNNDCYIKSGCYQYNQLHTLQGPDQSGFVNVISIKNAIPN